MDEDLTPQVAEEAALLAKAYNWEQCPLITFEDPPWEWDWLWDYIQSAVMSAARTVIGWVTKVYEEVEYWITYKVRSVISWITRVYEDVESHILSTARHVISWILDVKDSMGYHLRSAAKAIVGWVQEAWAEARDAIEFTISTTVDSIIEWVKSVADGITDLGKSMAGYFKELPGTISRELVDPISDWFAGFIENLIAIPVNFLTFLKRWLIDFPMWMSEGFGEKVIYGLSTSFAWVGRWMEQAVGSILEGIIGYVQRVGRVDPTNAPTVAGGLMSLVGVMVGGLSAMTLAGELMHPLKEIGMGHISAMIGDCVNYKAISGAFMGALVAGALTTPLRYYFNYALRPWLPGPAEIAIGMSRNLFVDPDSLNPELAEGIKSLVGPDGGVAFEKRLLGYRGFHDEYYPMFKELANSKIGYFALAAVASGGTFDEVIFKSEMMRAGYWPRAAEMLIDMYRRQALGEAKALYIGDPISAFKEGWFSEDRLGRELIECGIPEAALPRYLHAGWIKYEVDLLSDRLAGLKEAYRKGLVTDEQFSGSLTGWGMVPQRAEEHLSREQVRRYGLPVIIAYYKTAEGVIRVRTARRLWRAEVITDVEFLTTLIEYEMSASMAAAILDEERAMLPPPRIPPPVPLHYETDVGKIEFATVKDEFLKDIIDDRECRRRLLALEVSEEMADAIIDYLEVRKARRPTVEI